MCSFRFLQQTNLPCHRYFLPLELFGQLTNNDVKWKTKERTSTGMHL